MASSRLFFNGLSIAVGDYFVSAEGTNNEDACWGFVVEIDGDRAHLSCEESATSRWFDLNELASLDWCATKLEVVTLYKARFSTPS